MRLTVAICAWNRSRLLEQTLSQIATLRIPQDTTWELLVVDNNSTDETSKVVEAFSKASGLNVRRIFEARQGKCFALNRGIAEARGDVIAFTDDDVLPQPDWLTVIHKEFSGDPALGVISGRVELFNPADLPITIVLCTKRAEFRSAGDTFVLMAGCNFAVRRAAFERSGLFDPDLGPGSRLQAAEDSDFFYRAWRAGVKLVSEPSVLVYHNHGRRTAEAGLRIRRSYTVAAGAFYAKHTLRGDWLAARAMYWDVNWVIHHRDIKMIACHVTWLLRGFIHYTFVHFLRTLTRIEVRSSRNG